MCHNVVDGSFAYGISLTISPSHSLQRLETLSIPQMCEIAMIFRYKVGNCDVRMWSEKVSLAHRLHANYQPHIYIDPNLFFFLPTFSSIPFGCYHPATSQWQLTHHPHVFGMCEGYGVPRPRGNPHSEEDMQTPHKQPPRSGCKQLSHCLMQTLH